MSLWWLLALACSLERVTGQAVPLDPRFYASVEAVQGEPGVGGGGSVPFGGVEGPQIVIHGTVLSDSPGRVDVDVRVPDPTLPGGMDAKGKLMLDGPGAFELSVPQGLGALELQAFQDPDGDGPTGADPFAQIQLNVQSTAPPDVVLTLVAGARGEGGGPQHQEMPAGAPGGGEPGAPVTSGGPLPFADYQGDRVTLSGELVWRDPDAWIDVDLFRPDARAPGGRQMLGKLKLKPGAYQVPVPVDFGPLLLEAFIDLAGDGPGPGDPLGACAGNPVQVGAVDITGVDIVLSVPADGRMPGQPHASGAPPHKPSGI